MVVVGTKIIKPVRATDVARMLGERTLSLRALCCSDRINKWARYKPVRSSDTGILTQSQYEQMASQVTVNWGFDRTSMLSGINIYDLAAKAAAGGSDWAYNALDENSVCRLSDFSGYDHAAVPPCSVELPSGTVLTGTTYYVSLSAAASDGGLGLVDFKAALGGDTVWDSLRWAFCRIKNRGMVTQSAEISFGPLVKSGNFYLPYELETGRCELLVCATSATSAESPGPYSCILVPGGYSSVNAVKAYLDVRTHDLKLTYNSTSSIITSVSLDFTLTNNTDEAMSVGIGVFVRPKDAVLINPQADKTVLVPAGSTVTETVLKTTSVSVFPSHLMSCGVKEEGKAWRYFVPGTSNEVPADESWIDLGTMPAV